MASELLAPAGDFDTALTAFAAGADAVYLGLDSFSARAFAPNFSLPALADLLRVARAKGKKVYVTMNTLLDESQLEEAERCLRELDRLGPDGIIIQDLGLASMCREKFPRLAMHASTQLVAHNLEGVLALKEFGFKRVVLARELSFREIESIQKRAGVELEVFIHGALCYSLSGLCLFSAMEKGRSGNRGKCAYCCRLGYEKPEGGKTLAFSMKDLRLGEDVKKLEEIGIASLKIEGRMKSPLYVASAVAYYRGKLKAADLETVFSRRTTKLYFDGQPAERVIDPDSLGHLGTPIGTVKRVTKDREGRRWLRFHTLRALEAHDGLQFARPGKPAGMGISELRKAISRVNVFEVGAGEDVEVRLPDELEVEPGETVYCSMSNRVKNMFPVPGFRKSDYPGIIPIEVEVDIAPDGVGVKCGEVAFKESVELDAAKNPDKTFEAVKKAFGKLGDTDYRLEKLTVNDPDKRFVPASLLNDLRRELVGRLA